MTVVDTAENQQEAAVILQQPDLRLRQRSVQRRCFDAELIVQVNNLRVVMLQGVGGVGIAAPQIGWFERVIVVDCSLANRPCRHHGLLMMVNPRIVDASEKMKLGREGCLSVPDWVGMVERHQMVRVAYEDLMGVSQVIESHHYEARVIQHEIDHLDGVLFTDRVVSTRDLVRRMVLDQV
ncbi:MAG: peptide deformylase [Zetaproteobacteria bacterium]|nr:peptide deformylase [Zetaproteobacteria bacterium]